MSARAVSFFAPGLPRPKGSKRMVRTKGGRTLLLEESAREKPWRSNVTILAAQAMEGRERFVGEALFVCLQFTFPRPKAHYTTKGLRPTAPTWHTGAPDSSKLARSVEDALNGIVWDDDSRIATLHVMKSYCERDQLPGVRVYVNPLDAERTP